VEGSAGRGLVAGVDGTVAALELAADVVGTSSIGGTNGAPPPALARSATTTKRARTHAAMTAMTFQPRVTSAPRPLTGSSVQPLREPAMRAG